MINKLFIREKMEQLMNQMMIAYCMDYELLFCTEKKEVVSASINEFIGKYAMFFRYSNYTYVGSLILNGTNDKIKLLQFYGIADQVYIKSCTVLKRQRLPSGAFLSEEYNLI